MIEVSTFRAYLDAAAAEQVAGNEKTSQERTRRQEPRGRRRAAACCATTSGARRSRTRRGATSPSTRCTTTRVREIVVDYHGGIKDAKKKLLRMIGDPVTRYREDPVRIIRVVRFAAKLGFEIEPKTRAPIKEMAALLDNVPQLAHCSTR